MSDQFDPSRDRGERNDDFAPAALSRTDSEFKADRLEQMIMLPEGTTRGDAVYFLSQKVPTNEFGLPLWFYRSDMLPNKTALTNQEIDAAAEGLFYSDGYPVTQHGGSFWNQLPHEPFEPFKAFMKFLDQAKELGIRQLDLLSADQDLSLELTAIQQMYREFYWSARARAYDLFVVAAEAKKREFRIRGMENTHYNHADALLARLLEKFEEPAWIEELNAKEAIEVLDTLIKIQRLSVGLTGQHASSNQGQPITPGASSELILRRITKGIGITDQGSNAFGHKLEQLLGDEQAGMQLQELILRVNTTDHQMQGADFG